MKELVKKIDTICARRWFPLLFVPVAFVFLLFFSISTSPLFYSEGSDSVVFKTMGLALLKGKTLYVDIFDHKGFVLYLINAIGIKLSLGRWGIFILQMAGLSTALMFLFRTARLFTTPSKSLFSVLVSLVFLGGCFEGGNLTEEWNVYIICVVTYIVIRFIKERPTSPFPNKSAMLLGILFSLGFFIRPNDAVAQSGGAFLGIALMRLRKKEVRNVLTNLLFYIAGAALVAIPILVYYASKKAIPDLLYGLIFFNNEYAEGIGSLFVSLFQHSKAPILLIMFVTCYLSYYSNNRNLLWVMIPMCILQALFIGIRMYPHYLIVLTPIINTLVAQVFKQDKTVQIMTWAILIANPFVGERQMHIALVNTIKYNCLEYQSNQAYYPTDKTVLNDFFENIPENKRDSVWNYGNPWTFSVLKSLYTNNIVQCNKITIAHNDKLQKEDNLLEKRPPYIVVRPSITEYRSDSCLAKNYSPIAYAYTPKGDCNLILFKRTEASAISKNQFNK